MMVDPNWTLDEAQAAHDAALAADTARSGSDPTLPLFQWAALRTLGDLRQQFEVGDRMALLAAIRKCANHGLPLPAWIANAFIAAYDEVLNCRAKSWDDVFGNPYPKSANLAAMRKRRYLAPAVWSEVQATLMREPHKPIDAGLFERVGKRFAIGKTLTERIYYLAARRFGPAKRPG